MKTILWGLLGSGVLALQAAGSEANPRFASGLAADRPTGTASAARAPLYDSDADVMRGWSYYARDGKGSAKVRFKYGAANDPALLEIRSLQGGPAGLNMIVPLLSGSIEFEYRVLERESGSRFGVFVIPVRELLQGAPVEAGATQVGDPRNVESPFRVRFHVPAGGGNGQWHRARVEFDFRGIGGVVAAVVAPRVNEMTGASGAGTLQFRRFRIFRSD